MVHPVLKKVLQFYVGNIVLTTDELHQKDKAQWQSLFGRG